MSWRCITFDIFFHWLIYSSILNIYGDKLSTIENFCAFTISIALEGVINQLLVMI